jgi:hypothetical protein
MSSPADFTKFVPGFDFFQGLMKNAGQALPPMGQWIAPTLDPEELGKRIEQLKTVQFWLEQNAKLLGTTIQALEVQRMTLSTLKTMNLPVGRVAEAFKMPVATPEWAPEPVAAREPEPMPTSSPPPTPPTSPTPSSAPPRRRRAPSSASSPSAKPAASSPATSAAGADPMQWWGALTQQFTELASQALKDPAAATRELAAQAMKTASGMAGAPQKSAKTGAKTGPRTSTKTSARASATSSAKPVAKKSPRRGPSRRA